MSARLNVVVRVLFVRVPFIGVILAIACGVPGVARGEEPLVPIVLPWDDDAPAVFDEAVRRGPTPLTAALRLRATPDGHLAADGHRVRLWGVNVCFGANFPSAEDAPRVAARMAKFRINAVRFHHMDSARYPSGILARDGRTTRSLEGEALDRLHRFVHELGRRGVYSNINLLVGRHFSSADGLPKSLDALPPKQQHLLGFFSDDLLRLQQEYARELLAAPNPYSGTPLASDPAVAIVEINNENGLIHGWFGGELDQLPEPFEQRLRDRWNAWLKPRYADTETLRAAWRHRDEPLGEQRLRNADLSAGTQSWSLEQHAAAKASATVEPRGNGRNGPALRVEVAAKGDENWHVQFHQPGLAVRAGQLYTLRLRAKADRATTFALRLGQAHAPWQGLGFDARLPLTTDWQEFVFTFQPRADDDDARIGLSDLGRELGRCWLSDLSLRPGGRIGLAADQRLETAAIPLPRHSGAEFRTTESLRDWLAFLREVERDYWREMRRFLRDELQVAALLVGTIQGCSPATVQAEFDAIDSHAYWQHPHFPGRPWDPGNWTVNNESMVNSPPGTLGRIAAQHVVGKPHLVTEYNHSAPNTYSSEAPLLVAAYAALQDWDAVFLFAYSHRTNDWNARAFTSFFDIDQHPLKMANLLPAAALFRRGDVAAAESARWAPLNETRELDWLATRGEAWRMVDADTAGVPVREALERRIGWQPHDDASPVSTARAADSPVTAIDRASHLSETRQLRWDTTRKNRGVVTLDAPRSKAVIGFVDGRSFSLGDITVMPGVTRQDWCTIAITRLGAGALVEPGRALVTLTGAAENTEMRWLDDTRRSVGRQWGRAPSLMEVVPAILEWPGAPARVKAWALDERGQRGAEIPVAPGATADRARIQLGPPAKTPWYMIEMQ